VFSILLLYRRRFLFLLANTQKENIEPSPCHERGSKLRIVFFVGFMSIGRSSMSTESARQWSKTQTLMQQKALRLSLSPISNQIEFLKVYATAFLFYTSLNIQSPGSTDLDGTGSLDKLPPRMSDVNRPCLIHPLCCSDHVDICNVSIRPRSAANTACCRTDLDNQQDTRPSVQTL
jgi:hypothetical protein